MGETRCAFQSFQTIVITTGTCQVCKHSASRARIVASSRRTPAQIVLDAQRVFAKDKPVWCQPWTIVGTGAAAIWASWTLLHGLAQVISVGVTAAVLLWWYLFLVVYPQSVVEESGDGRNFE